LKKVDTAEVAWQASQFSTLCNEWVTHRFAGDALESRERAAQGLVVREDLATVARGSADGVYHV